jgi:hypothetical protein
LLKKGQMQVDLSEIPPPGAPEILCRERIYAFPTVLQRLALLDNTLVDLRVYHVSKYVALLSKN